MTKRFLVIKNLGFMSAMKHLLHKLEFATYTGADLSLECVNCFEVLVDLERDK